MYEKKRLHPATVLFRFFQLMKDFFLPIIISFVTIGTEGIHYFFIVIAIILIIFIPSSILSWYRFTYETTDEELIIEQGVFIRKKRYISKNRIHSIDLTQNLLHRVFKLVQVQIETAGSGEGAEVSFKAVSLRDGEQLREQLKATKEKVSEQHEGPFDKITSSRLFLAGTTSGSIGVIFALFAAFSSQFEQLIPEDFYNETFQWFISLSILFMIGFIILLLFILWFLGILGTMIKYGNFTITRRKNELFITRGLLEKKQITIPVDRIQAVGIDESIFRQPLGFATVFVEVAGGALDDSSDFATVLFPILKRNEIEPFLKKYLEDYVEADEKMTRLPKRSVAYYFVRPLVPIVILSFIIYLLFPDFVFIPVALILLTALQAWLVYKDSGYQLGGNRLTLQYRRLLTRRTVRIFKNRIQAFEVKQHKLHKLHHLASIKGSILASAGNGKHYIVKELAERDADRIFSWYSSRKM